MWDYEGVQVVIIKLSRDANGQEDAEVDISDETQDDGTVGISIDSWPSCAGPGDQVFVNRSEAAAIVDHLRKVFGL